MGGDISRLWRVLSKEVNNHVITTREIVIYDTRKLGEKEYKFKALFPCISLEPFFGAEFEFDVNVEGVFIPAEEKLTFTSHEVSSALDSLPEPVENKASYSIWWFLDSMIEENDYALFKGERAKVLGVRREGNKHKFTAELLFKPLVKWVKPIKILVEGTYGNNNGNIKILSYNIKK